MKFRFIAALFVLLTFFGINSKAQTTTAVSGSTLTNNSTGIQVSIPDGSGGTYMVSVPIASVAVTHTTPPPPPPPPVIVQTAPTIPSTAIAVNLVTNGTWKACEHDAGTPGTGVPCANLYPVNGIFTDPVAPAREFSMTYTNGGGVRWANTLANDPTSTNFVLDALVYSTDWTHVADLELDTNQVKADGNTTILGTECASQSGFWQITLTGTDKAWHWIPTAVKCNTLKWTPNTPHHIRIFGTISASDVSTYEGVEFDGTYTAFTAMSGSTADALGWSKGTVLTNVQIDGYQTSGSPAVYMSNLTIYRW